MKMLPAIRARFRPSQLRASPAEALRAALGAGIGILLTALLSSAWLGPPGATPLLIAPIGASAVLLFAVPASPLAQPFPMLAGNLIAALLGVTAARWIPDPAIAAALAVGIAIGCMALLRCVHPPSGAIALTAVLGGPQVHAAGYGFVLVPVLLNSGLLFLAALLYNNLTGRSYPHVAHAVAHPHPPSRPIELTRADFERVIADYGETLEIGADDLAKLFEELMEGEREAERAHP